MEMEMEMDVKAYLVNPVRVEDAEVASSTTNTLFGNRAQVTGELEVGDTLVGGLTVHDTLRNWSLSGASSDTDTVDDVTLLSLVAQSTSFVGAGWARSSVDRGKLAVLPASNAKQEAKHVGLLLLPKFFQVLVGT
jgi:hypothetical protein